MKIVAIVQARMGSTRLPGKVLQKICGKSVIDILLQRLKKSRLIDEICVATTENPEDDVLCSEIDRLGFRVYRGSENDVLGRYYHASKFFGADYVVRITGDCPVIDPEIVDNVISLFLNEGADYASNTSPPTFADGLDVEIFKMSALEEAYRSAVSSFEREHVTPFIRENCNLNINFYNETDQSSFRLTLDQYDDFVLLNDIFEAFAPAIHFSYYDVIEYINTKPEKIRINRHIKRNEGSSMGTGQKLWTRAKNVIPGGNMLLSKRSEMHLPTNWPSYFSKTSGCSVWDLDGNKYTDLYLMGVGTNILGYSHSAVDAAVMEVVRSGNLSSLNAPEEVYLAEKLVELNPWASMVRFARSGGEANAIAVRIARAASGRDGVAVCGYHGWHDWYLSANLGQSDNLAEHLLPGLSVHGVPKALRGQVHPFQYNDLNHLKELIANESIGVIKMEVYRNIEPENNFLKLVRKLASDAGIVLVFDECTSGFRECFGGLHQKYEVEPDIAVYGKTLGNGYAISAIVGREEIMQAAQSTFISSTFWTERIGSVAGLKTLETMEIEKPWEHAIVMGQHMRQIWEGLAKKYKLEIEIFGLAAISGFSFKSEHALGYKTLLTQEALKSGYLGGNLFYASLAHSVDILDEYADYLDPIFKIIAECEDGRNISDFLEGPICHSGFKRLN